MLDEWTLQATPAISRPTNLENHRAKRKAKPSPETATKQIYKIGDNFAKKELENLESQTVVPQNVGVKAKRKALLLPEKVEDPLLNSSKSFVAEEFEDFRFKD